MRVAIYSGTVPSTVFIERLIEGLAETGVEILLHGQIVEPVRYRSENIKVVGYTGKLSKIWIAFKYSLLLFLTAPKRLLHLKKCYSQTNRSQTLLNWFAKAAPIVWHKTDVFHLQWAKGIEDWIFLRDFGVKLVLSLRGTHINCSPIVDKELAEMYSKFFPQVDAFHGVSKAICSEAEKYGVDQTKCHTIYSGLNLDEFPFREKKENPNSIKIVSVGRPHWVKGYCIALDAMKILNDQGLLFDYTIIGGKSEELIYQISDLDLEMMVHLEEFMPFEEVKSVITESDVLLMPSIEEGLPNVVLEAMALGTIVISTDCGGVSEVIKEGKNGFLVGLRNAVSISSKIKAVKKSSFAELDLIRKKARATIETQHNHQQMVDDMKELYLSVK